MQVQKPYERLEIRTLDKAISNNLYYLVRNRLTFLQVKFEWQKWIAISVTAEKKNRLSNGMGL